MKKKPHNVLIINTFGIGDVLFSTPLISALKRALPDSSIDFICNRRCQPILENNDKLREIIVFEKDEFREVLKRSKLVFTAKIYGLIDKIRRKRYDLAIDLSLGYQFSLFLFILGVKRRVGFNFRNRGRFLNCKLDIDGFSEKHVVEYYLDVLKLIGIDDDFDRQLELNVKRESRAWLERVVSDKNLSDKKIVAIVPGSGKSWGPYASYRRWSPDNFIYVANNLAARKDNIFFIIIGSEDEKDVCEMVMKGLGKKAMNLCGKTSLLELAALLKRSSLLLCNEGGILHIGVSQRIKTVSIFGPVDDRVYGPYPHSALHKVVVAEGVDCRPCYSRFRHRFCDLHLCLTKVDRERMLEMAWESLVS